MTDKPLKLLVDALGAIDLRNRIIHGYDSVDDEIVYATVTDDLHGLHADLSTLLALRG